MLSELTTMSKTPGNLNKKKDVNDASKYDVHPWSSSKFLLFLNWSLVIKEYLLF